MKAEKSIAPISSFDPLATLLIDRLHLTPVAFGIIFLLVNVLVDAWIGFRFDVFVTNSTTPGLLQDLPALTIDLVVMPVIGGVYLWTVSSGTMLFRSLYDSQTLVDEKRFIATVDQGRALFGNRKVFYLAAGIAAFAALSELGGYLGWFPWRPVGGYIDLAPAIGFYRLPLWLINSYTLWRGALNIGITILTLRKVFQSQKVTILPKHPDGCGGLGSIGRYLVTMAYAIGVIGLMASTATYANLRTGGLADAKMLLFGLAVYLVMAPLLFFWPLGTAHRAMVNAKEKELLRLAQEIDSNYQQAKQKIHAENADYQPTIARIESLTKLYAIAQELPVWPFNVAALRRFFTIILTPLVPAVVPIAIELVSARLF